MNKIKIDHQGDVFLIPTPHLAGEIPGAKPVPEDPRHPGRHVLAYGEVTGHAHTLDARCGQLLETDDGVRFLKLVDPGALDHEEHDRQEWGRGTYRVSIGREWTPEAIRSVAD